MLDGWSTPECLLACSLLSIACILIADIALYTLWGLLSIAGFIFQCYIERNRPQFPAHRRTRRGADELTTQQGRTSPGADEEASERQPLLSGATAAGHGTVGMQQPSSDTWRSTDVPVSTSALPAPPPYSPYSTWHIFELHKTQSRTQAGFTLVQVQVRVSLHGLAIVALYCKQCYVMWTLYYLRHNNDVIVDVKTFWRLFSLFSWRKRRTVHKNCSCLKVTRTRIQNSYYCEWLLLEYMQTCVYCNPIHGYPDSYQCEASLSYLMDTVILTLLHASKLMTMLCLIDVCMLRSYSNVLTGVWCYYDFNSQSLNQNTFISNASESSKPERTDRLKPESRWQTELAFDSVARVVCIQLSVGRISQVVGGLSKLFFFSRNVDSISCFELYWNGI